MTALLDSAALDQAGDTGTTLIRLLRAEFMKIRTTSTGWLFLAGFIMFTALALTINRFGHHYQLYPQQGLVSRAQGLAQAAQARSPAGVAKMAASMMTSGQRIGVLFALLIGVLIVTSEFANQTAAVTFVTVPRRTMVVITKVAAAAGCGALFWLMGTILAAIAVASEVMITSGPAFPYAPPGWVGGVIMIGYAVALAAAGIAMTKRRDVI